MTNKFTNLWRTALVGVVACALATCQHKDAPTSFDVDAALSQCSKQLRRTMSQLSATGHIDTTMMPRNVASGDTAWSLRPVCAEEWCSGFWPGILWMGYQVESERQLSGSGSADDERYLSSLKKAAVESTVAMRRIVDAPVFDHDLGFLIFCSAGTGLRVLDAELQRKDLPADVRAADEAAADVFRTLCLRAADSLATLFRPNVGTILSWPRNIQMFGGHNTIMDNMINLELLCWAGHTDIAIRHAATTMQHHFRPDGSSYHVAVYDTLTGDFIRGVTHQGYADSSMWARGQAWAIYGFTTMYRFTREQRFLSMAERAADIFLKRLGETSDDWVPYWDFDDPRIHDPKAPRPKDASAAAVVASALLELCQYAGQGLDEAADSTEDGGHAGSKYFVAAEEMLRCLASSEYQAGKANPAFLLHSTGNLPAGSEIDVPIVYADYYYLEALLRYRHLIQTPDP